jgi:amidase
MTVKESYNIAGLPTTWGFPPQKDFRPPEDALSISRVKAAGGVIPGKTNVPVGLGDWQSYNEIYGTTNNPFDLGRTPGGSSGGSAAALAAGYGPLSLGSAIGGSLRVPAFHCGVYAHKPSYNVAPVRGHTPPPFPPIPLDRDMAVIGPMARSAADLSLLLDVIAGPEPLDAGVGYKLTLPPPRRNALSRAGGRQRSSAAVRQGHSRCDREAVGQPRQSGGEHRAADFTDSSRLYMRMLMSFLGTFFPPEVIAGAQASAAQLTADNKSLAAERLRGMTQSHRDWVLDDGARGRLRAQWRELFKTFDAVICPIMPTPAYPHDHSPQQEARRIKIDGKDYAYPDQLAWPGIATLPGLPATAIPLGLSPEGLPVGIQIVGPWLEDRTPLELAALIEREFGGFVPPPMFDD